jgi:hypothetical protein
VRKGACSKQESGKSGVQIKEMIRNAGAVNEVKRIVRRGAVNEIVRRGGWK